MLLAVPWAGKPFSVTASPPLPTPEVKAVEE